MLFQVIHSEVQMPNAKLQNVLACSLLMFVQNACHNPAKIHQSVIQQVHSSEGQRPVNSTCQAIGSSAQQGTNSDVPKLLSKTGCVKPDDPTRPSEGHIPYEINSPLWSDGADKERFFAIPDNATIKVDPNGHLELPPLSVTMKLFRLKGKPVETRLYMRGIDGRWSGYSYEWRDDGKDAVLLEEGKEKLIGDQTWVFPSPQQCDVCHTKVAGVTLGLGVTQLSRTILYPGRSAPIDQLSFLRSAKILSDLVDPQQLKALPQLVDYSDPSQTIDSRARSYLYGNCAYCHQPKGGGIGDFDLRIEHSFKDMRVCKTPPAVSNLNVDGAVIIMPLQTTKSVLYLRMKNLGDGHMPPITSRLVDNQGLGLIRDWILIRSDCEEL